MKKVSSFQNICSKDGDMSIIIVVIMTIIIRVFPLIQDLSLR